MTDAPSAIPAAPVLNTPPASEPANAGNSPAEEQIQTILDPFEPPEAPALPADASQPEPEIELDTIEFDGQHYQVPRPLKDAFLRQQDYTQKTQATAAERRALEQREQAVEQQFQASEQEIQDRATLVNIEAKLAPYKNYDWMAGADIDPVAVQKHKLYFDRLREAQAEVAQRVNGAQTQRTQAADQDFDTRRQQTAAFAKSIPGWTPDLDNKLQKFAAEQGVDETFVRRNLSPTFYRIMHLAYLGQQTSQKKAPAARLIGPGEPGATLQPLATVKPGATPINHASLSELAKSDDATAYVEARRAQQKRDGAR